MYRRAKRPVLDPQMGYMRVDPYVKEAIQVWCLFETLRDSKTKRGMIAAIAQYLQSHVQDSLPLYVYRQLTRSSYVSDWTSLDGTSQIEEMIETAFGTESSHDGHLEMRILDPQDGSIDAVPWFESMDSAFTNWQEFRNSTIAKRFTHLINIIVSAGMCSTANLEFKMGNVTLFSPIIIKKQLAAGDVFEAFYEAVSGFMKGGWRVFQTGEVSSFFIEDDKFTQFDSMYNEIRSWHGYALTGNLTKYTDIDENEYENRLKKAIEFGENLLRSIKRTQPFERKYISDRLDRIRDNETEFTQLRTRGGLRVSPFAVCLFGQSGAGKSTLTNLTVNAGLVYNDLSAEKDRIATWADNDKYASSVRSHINAIIFDDFANTKEQFMDFSPAYRLIQVINNIKYLAPMADVFLKGKVSINPYFCLVSTNVEHLNAALYSNEPESVLRRLYHVVVVPKKRFRTHGTLDRDKVEAEFGVNPCPDAWDLTVRYYEVQNVSYVNHDAFKPVIFDGKPLVDISVHEYLRWVQLESKRHFQKEYSMIESQSSIPSKCEHCELTYCNCPGSFLQQLAEQSEDPEKPILDVQSGIVPSYRSYMSSFFHRRSVVLKEYFENAKTSTILASESICSTLDAIDFLPESVICHPKILQFGLIFWRESIRQSLIAGNALIFLFMLFLCYGIPVLSVFWIVFAMLIMYVYTCATIQTYRLMIRSRILELKDVVQTYTRRWQFKYALIGMGAIALILSVMKSRYTELNAQSTLNPDSFEDVRKRNDADNPWLAVETDPVPMPEPCKTTSSSNLAKALKTNLIGIISEGGRTTLGFYVMSNFLMLPTHFIDAHPDEDIKIRCYKKAEEKVGSYFRDKISRAYTVSIPNTDFSIAFITSGGSMKDFRKFLPITPIFPRMPARLVTRNTKDDNITILPTLTESTSEVRHSMCTFYGMYYNLPVETKEGMCMSPLISDGKGSTILGFHLGGKRRLGGCGVVTAFEVERALSELSNRDGVVMSASSGVLEPEMGTFPMETMGKPTIEGNDIHPKSALNFLTDGAFVEVYGQTSGKATPHSNVTPTMISEAVEEVFDVPQKWGPPKMKGKGRYPYQEHLKHASNPSLPIGSVLAKAVASMKGLTKGLKQKIPELFTAKPLSRVATVSGLKGERFIDAMNFSSSPGFPLSGSKHPLVVDLDPKDYPECGKPRTFVDPIWEEFDKICGILKSEKRCYMIWKSCLKDEATKLSSDKVRVFQSAPLVLQLIIRMYFLPIVRIIQMNPILFECAVGVNAEGLEWDELWEAAMSKGKDRVLAGDYSKYDIRMPAQVTIAAFDILIDIAEQCSGYTAEDIHLMKMVVHEVVYPVMAHNGDLIQLFGTNPSGQNLTVIINSLVNSLLLRCCFFTLYPDLNFKEHCSFLTYGDDLFGTVSALCSKFTHIAFAEWLALHDMVFTMPDKESEPVPYMCESDVDFLKRKSVYNEDLSQKVGLLSEESIFKRLHAHLLSNELTLPMHSAENIQSSLHDWFFYGREVFEDRQAKLKKVAEKCDIVHMCPALNVSYDKCVNRWRHKYLGEELLEPEEELEILEPQCGTDVFVETYDFLDHCRGSAHQPRFWWEFILIALNSAIVSLVPFCITRGWVTIEYFPRKPSFWTMLYVVYWTGGFSIKGTIQLVLLILNVMFYTHFLPAVSWLIAELL